MQGIYVLRTSPGAPLPIPATRARLTWKCVSKWRNAQTAATQREHVGGCSSCEGKDKQSLLSVSIVQPRTYRHAPHLTISRTSSNGVSRGSRGPSKRNVLGEGLWRAANGARRKRNIPQLICHHRRKKEWSMNSPLSPPAPSTSSQSDGLASTNVPENITNLRAGRRRNQWHLSHLSDRCTRQMSGRRLYAPSYRLRRPRGNVVKWSMPGADEHPESKELPFMAS